MANAHEVIIRWAARRLCFHRAPLQPRACLGLRWRGRHSRFELAHPLWFLDLAATAGFEVDSYRDSARGHLTRRVDGKQRLSKVELSPIVEFSQIKWPTDELLEALHHQAHEACFPANAVKCEVIVKRGDR